MTRSLISETREVVSVQNRIYRYIHTFSHLIRYELNLYGVSCNKIEMGDQKLQGVASWEYTCQGSI